MSKPLIMGVTNLSFHRVTASLIANVLHDMGFEVKRTYAPLRDNYERLKNGDLDLLGSTWLGCCRDAGYKTCEPQPAFLELGLHYEPYAMWGVPDYLAVGDVATVSDLLKPEVIDRMNPMIRGITNRLGTTQCSRQIMSQYGLTEAGYSFIESEESDCIDAFEQALDKGEWIVMPLWKPQFFHHHHQLRKLKEPRGLLGVADRTVMLLREDRQSRFTADQLKVLDSLRFSNEIIAELDYLVTCCNESLDQVTRRWLAS